MVLKKKNLAKGTVGTYTSQIFKKNRQFSDCTEAGLVTVPHEK